MIQVLHKLLALILAFVVLFTSFSFTVEKHVCMGKVADVSYFTEADSCDMVMEEEECVMDDFSGDKMDQEDCCNDIQELIPGIQNEQQAIAGMELNQVSFILAFTYTYLNLLETKEDITPFVASSPPIIDKDLQILYQSFLI